MQRFIHARRLPRTSEGDRNCATTTAIRVRIPGTTTVVRGTNGTNLWSYTFNTSSWCGDAGYWAEVTKENWTNVTRAHTGFNLV